MANRANLIATYNANPTLQSRYTLPQYLALFDFSQTTTPTPTPTPTPDPTPGIPNIINQNLNQGGGGDGGPQGIARPSETYTRTYAPNLNFAEFTSGITGTPSYTQEYNKPETIFDLYQKFSPLGFIGRKIEANKVAKQKALDDAFAKAEAERKAKEAIAEAERAAQYGKTNYGQGAGGQSYSNMGTQGFGVAAGGYGGPVSNRTGKGRQDYDDGGRVYLYNRLK